MIKLVYQSQNYSPELVTGRYVRCTGDKRKGYVFRVFETATGNGTFKGKLGYGPTLREYDTVGADIPVDIQDKAIASKQTEAWPL